MLASHSLWRSTTMAFALSSVLLAPGAALRQNVEAATPLSAPPLEVIVAPQQDIELAMEVDFDGAGSIRQVRITPVERSSSIVKSEYKYISIRRTTTGLNTLFHTQVLRESEASSEELGELTVQVQAESPAGGRIADDVVVDGRIIAGENDGSATATDTLHSLLLALEGVEAAQHEVEHAFAIHYTPIATEQLRGEPQALFNTPRPGEDLIALFPGPLPGETRHETLHVRSNLRPFKGIMHVTLKRGVISPSR